MLKLRPIYLKLYSNKIEITLLDKDKTITRVAKDKFSNSRLVIADFQNAEKLINSMLRELFNPILFFNPVLKILIQQMEKTEDGLSPVEIRILKDIGERCGGRKVKITEKTNEFSLSQALKELNE